MAMRKAAYASPEAAIPENLQRIIELVNEAVENQQSTIIFSYFRSVIAAVHSQLGELAYDPIAGDMPPAAREAIVVDFNQCPTPQVIVGQIMAAGTGLNIQHASVVIICEPQIKPTLETQAIARAQRIGQVRTVQVHRMINPESIDAQMQDMLSQKQAEFGEYARPSALAQGSETAMAPGDVSIERTIISRERERLGISPLPRVPYI